MHAVLGLERRAGGAGVARRRIAVASFTGATTGDTSATALHDRLVMAITQTGRFAVVDRSHEADYDNEMAVIQSQAVQAERGRASQVLGADYVLTGKLHLTGGKTTGHAAHTTSQTIELTGEVVSTTAPGTLRHSAGAADADFELIEMATRQIVLADHVSLSGTSLDAVADSISADIVGAIYPPRLVSIADPSALIISQGGAGMHRGARFRLMQAGDELFDPYTHESLGRAERQVGEVEIADVQAHLSYARLIAGALPHAPENAVLRPEPVAAAPKPSEAASRRHVIMRSALAQPPPAIPKQGVQLPFDR